MPTLHQQLDVLLPADEPTEGMDGAVYGYPNMGPYDGGQAEYLRVPHADFNLLEAAGQVPT